MAGLNNCVEEFNKCITDAAADFGLCFRLYGRCLANSIIESFDPSQSQGVIDSGSVTTRFISYIISQIIFLEIKYAPIFDDLKKSGEFPRSVKELITGIEETLNQNEKVKQFLPTI